MPTYTVKYSNINLSQKQKNSIANDITYTHSKLTGANTFFAQVIFQKNQKKAHFMGGKLVKTKEIFLNGQIRAGRTSNVKKKLILGILTADCAPVFIYDKELKLISAIHAGWKGAYKGIVKRVVKFFVKNTN